MFFMMAASRISVCSNVHESRLAFCCISLRGRRHGHLTGDLPDISTSHVLGVLSILHVVRDAAALAFLDPFYEIEIDILLVVYDTDITGRYVRILADVAHEFGHEALAKAHDLIIASALRVEVGAAFAAANGQAGKSIREDLFEAEELDDAGIDGGMKTEATLVGAEGAVVLHAKAAVDMHLAQGLEDLANGLVNSTSPD